MLKHSVSTSDLEFLRAFEACEIEADAFDHRAHVRLAYIYLCEEMDEAAKNRTAYDRMKRALLVYLNHLGIGPAKYHETITRAWLLAVRHFMSTAPQCDSADVFIQAHPKLLDTRIMLSHYSENALFSDSARAQFVEPDLEPIPKH